jgi:hypothetical protein
MRLPARRQQYSRLAGSAVRQYPLVAAIRRRVQSLPGLLAWTRARLFERRGGAVRGRRCRSSGGPKREPSYGMRPTPAIGEHVAVLVLEVPHEREGRARLSTS